MEPPLKTLIAAFLLTAIATAVALQLPNTEDLVALALVLDLVPFAAALGVAVTMVIHYRRANVQFTFLLCMVYLCSASALVGTLGVAHLVAVITLAMSTSGEHGSAYDLRTYALILLGIAFILCGFLGAMLASRLTRTQRSAWVALLVIWSVILMIDLPLMPRQGFAVLFSILAALGIFMLYGIRRMFLAKFVRVRPDQGATTKRPLFPPMRKR